MDGEIKRPYDPSIEVVTRPGEKVRVKLSNGQSKEVNTPARLSVLLRSQVKFYYGVFGLRFPDGVDRKEIICSWDEDNQQCVLEAPWHGGGGATHSYTVEENLVKSSSSATPPPPLLLMMGSSIGFGGFGMESIEAGGLNPIQQYSTMFNSGKSTFLAGSVLEIDEVPKVLTSDKRNVRWGFNYLPIQDIDLLYEIVEVEEGADACCEKKAPREYPPDFFDGDGHYERQNWFRNPQIKISHFDGEADIGGMPDGNPYDTSPFSEKNEK